jgi:tetratricopeptide (TPR) repeat protein
MQRHEVGPSVASKQRALLVVVAVAAFAAACGQVGELQARKAFKDANQKYQSGDYKAAAELYEDTIKANPGESRAYFYLGNSYENQFKAAKKGEPANDEFLNKAVKNYELSAQKLANATDPNDKLLAKRSLEYLALVYSSDKLNDPSKAEPIVQKMIDIDPSEPTNYFALAKIYEDAGDYDRAEATYLKAKAAKPNDPLVYTTLATYYNNQHMFDKTMEALQMRADKDPTNPEAFHTIASYYWDEARKDKKLKPEQKREYILKGLQASDKAIELKKDYVEAIAFKGLLLREQAAMEKDPAKQKELIDEAVKLGQKANDLRQKQTTDAAAPAKSS